MRSIPPLVTAAIIGGREAYLLEWQRLPAMDGGGWGARICWVEQDEAGAWYARGGIVPADQLGQIPGQDYTKVPRDSRPTDPTDPRDPKARRSERDREYFRQALGRPPGLAERPERDDDPF